jgi:hypothetical protein
MGHLRTLALAAAILPASLALAQDILTAPAIDGYVTRVDSAAGIQVNGIQIVPARDFKYALSNGHGETAVTPTAVPYVGELAMVFGKLDRKHRTIAATRVVLTPVLPGVVSGLAIIDQIPTASIDPRQKLVRADGYRLILTENETLFKSTPANLSLDDLQTNMWIAYRGKRMPDGAILVDKASVWQNKIRESDGKVIAKSDYDPTQIDPNAHQSGFNKWAHGFNPRLVPPYPDAVAQARIDRIGNSLIPAYQRALPPSDPTRLTFRFELMDDERWQDARTLPSGVILVPVQIVDLLPDDSQLATVLADNIACALEQQGLRAIPADQRMFAAEILGDAATFLVPGAALVTNATNFGVRSRMARHAVEQSGRVSLTLLSDAGYDIHKAPETWWRLYTKPGGELADHPLPPRAAYLYQTLGTSWNGIVAPPTLPTP